MMNLAPTPANQVQRLASLVSNAHEHAQATLLERLSKSFVDANGLLASLSPEDALGSPDQYKRHIVHADPRGAFTMMFLVWRPGQFSPVHAHHVWCAYKVLQGNLSEQHFRYDALTGEAILTGGIKRQQGDVAAALPGLEQIHRLGNSGADVAISLHIYGIESQNVPDGINHVLETKSLN